MCLAVPVRVVKVEGQCAEVDLGGVSRQVRLDLLEEDLQPGDYVLVHSGFVMHKLKNEDAQSRLELWKGLLNGAA